MSDRFAACLPLILRHEGGYVDHPRDPGGATNLGITLAAAKAHRLDVDGDGDVDKADVRGIKPKDAAVVYLHSYWRPAGCDFLPPGVDYIIFDIAVNSGVKRAKRFLQEAVGVKVDHRIGPQTIGETMRIGGPEVIRRIAHRREAFYRSLGTFPTFGKGWLRRSLEVEQAALRMARAA